MSHYTTLETVFTDADSLLRGLKYLGFDVVEFHETPTPLFGYLGDKRAEKANIIVRREYVGRLSNDIGFIRNAQGAFQAIVSDYDKAVYGERWMRKLRVEYSKACVYSFADEQGYAVDEQKVAGKKEIRLVLRRFA